MSIELIRQAFSEDYAGSGLTLVRKPYSDDYDISIDDTIAALGAADKFLVFDATDDKFKQITGTNFFATVPAPIVFANLGAATKMIDGSASGLSGTGDYWNYNSASAYWRADGRLQSNKIYVVEAGTLNLPDDTRILFGTNEDAQIQFETNGSNDFLKITTKVGNADYSGNIVIGGDYQTQDFDHAVSANPTLHIHSNTDPDTRNDEFATLAHDTVRCGADYGSYCQIKSITEEITVAVGTGATPVVETSGNLAPASSMILGATFRTTDAPGGGATVIDIGVTGGGNLDALIDGKSCDGLGETGNTLAGDGDATAMPIMNAAAATLTLTTDADVSGDDMKIRITVFYIDMSAPSA
jgi:hypothetical protein